MAVNADPIVEISNVCFSYPNGIQALEQVSFQVTRGERLGIIGANGSGKSTLLQLLNGVLPLQRGSIVVNGLMLNTKNERYIRQIVGLLFQNPEDQLFCPTVYDDVAFGPLNYGLSESEVSRKTAKALAEVGLSGYEKRSIMGLSFGEKKLVALATVLAIDPIIVALDEPSSNLDAMHRRKLINWLQKNGRTCLITSHDLDLILDCCQRTIILYRGRLVAMGDTQSILSDQELLGKYQLELPLRWQK